MSDETPISSEKVDRGDTREASTQPVFQAKDRGATRRKSSFDWIPAIVRYQKALFEEKLALVQVPAVRAHLTEHIITLHEPSKQRRVTASEVVELVSRACSRTTHPDADFVRHLDSIGFNMLWWNQLREKAESESGPEVEAWKAKSAELARVAEPLIQEAFPLVERTLARLYRGFMRDQARALGILGLYRALERFDPTRGTHFPSYAVFWIRNELRKEITERKVVHETEYGRKCRLRQEKEIGDEGQNLPVSLSRATPLVISLDEFVKTEEDDGATLHELLPDESSTPQVEDRKAVAREWVRLLEGASYRQRMILVLRYFYPVWELEGTSTMEFPEAQRRLAQIAKERLFVGVSKALGMSLFNRAPESEKRKGKKKASSNSPSAIWDFIKRGGSS